MNSRSLVATAALTIALAASESAAGTSAADEDLSWLNALPGLEGGTQSSAGDATTITYTIRGDADAVYAMLVRGLTDRDWVVRRSRGVLAGTVAEPGPEGRSLRATKGVRALHASIAGSRGEYRLVVRLERAPAAARPPTTPASPPRAAPAAGTLGGKIEVRDNNVTRQIVCADFDAVYVLGNGCRVTLRGACDALSVTGNGNVVDVSGSVDQIEMLGESNSVTWSSAANPTRPRLSLLGSRNKATPREDPKPEAKGR